MVDDLANLKITFKISVEDDFNELHNQKYYINHLFILDVKKSQLYFNFFLIGCLFNE